MALADTPQIEALPPPASQSMTDGSRIIFGCVAPGAVTAAAICFTRGRRSLVRRPTGTGPSGGLKLPPLDNWFPFWRRRQGPGAEVRRALPPDGAPPVAGDPRGKIRRRYSENWPLRWHPEPQIVVRQAHEQMTALNRAIELLSGIDARILASEECYIFRWRWRYGGQLPRTAQFHHAVRRFDEGLTDWIYAAEFRRPTPIESIWAATVGEWAMLEPQNGRARPRSMIVRASRPGAIIDTRRISLNISDDSRGSMRCAMVRFEENDRPVRPANDWVNGHQNGFRPARDQAACAGLYISGGASCSAPFLLRRTPSGGFYQSGDRTGSGEAAGGRGPSSRPAAARGGK